MSKASEAAKLIDRQAAEAVKVIAEAKAEATHLIANAAADALKASQSKIDGDHDLIIEIRTVQQTMLAEIREIKDGTAKRLADVEQQKLDIKDSYAAIYKKSVDAGLDDIFSLKIWRAIMVSSIGLILFIGALFYRIYTTDLNAIKDQFNAQQAQQDLIIKSLEK